ncbi:MAG: flagellar biosynthesis protein FlhF [Thermacetogeniaceae bacterium]
MKIKRFVANDMQEALAKVKSVLGNDAIILQTRRFRKGGIFGLFGRSFVEVTAAVDENEHHSRPRYEVPFLPPNTAALPKAELDTELKKEIEELKTLVGEMLDDLENKTSLTVAYPKNFHRIYKILVENEVEEKLARKIVSDALEVTAPALWQDYEEILKTVERLIVKRIHVRPITFSKENEKKRIALVGPTGVGKTTTIAKLAAIFAMMKKKKIALATVDTYRIAAVDQLRTFAEIISVPLEVAYTPLELGEALKRHQDKELILIDTAGRSPLNELHMSELKSFLELCNEVEIFLVLSATTKYADLMETIHRFSHLPIKQLIFTKLDETNHYGTILNIANKTKKAIAYITTGQNVPDDIEVPDPEKIAKLLLQVK